MAASREGDAGTNATRLSISRKAKGAPENPGEKYQPFETSFLGERAMKTKKAPTTEIKRAMKRQVDLLVKVEAKIWELLDLLHHLYSNSHKLDEMVLKHLEKKDERAGK